jgi:hypothetical protein
VSSSTVGQARNRWMCFSAITARIIGVGLMRRLSTREIDTPLREIASACSPLPHAPARDEMQSSAAPAIDFRRRSSVS